MNYLRSLYCRLLVRFGRDHPWRRARKGEESPFPIKVCRRCGVKQPIKARIRAVPVKALESVRGGG